VPANRARKLLVLRIIHGLFATLLMACVGLIYYAGITGRALPWAYGAGAFLIIEGILIAANGWDCPLDFLHRSLGDDKGFFGLFLPRYWQRRVIPLLSGVTGIGLLILVIRAL
jgi:hypothetical protein